MTTSSNESQDNYISSGEAATLLDISVGTVLNMVQRGALKAWRTQGGHRRIDRQSVLALRAARNTTDAAASGSPLKILVIEDDVQMRDLYEINLTALGLPLSLRFAESGVEGLVETGRDMPDLLLLDLMMPDVDGFSVLKQVRQMPRHYDMAIVVVSGLDDQAIAEAGGLPAGVLLWRKPLNFLQLKGFVEGMLVSQRRPIVPV